jgi:cell division transport system permease protein
MKSLTKYLTHHLQAMTGSLSQFGRTPFSSFMTCLVIGIALALPTLLFVTLKNLEGLGTHLQQTMQVTLFLKTETKTKEIEQLQSTLQNNKEIAALKIISPQEGLKELQEQTGFQGNLLALSKNPLPWVIIVTPQKNTNLNHLVDTLKVLPQVETLQQDQIWTKRLASLMSFSHRLVYALAAFLGLAVFIIIHNAILSRTEQHQTEITVIKLIGGTTHYIRRPFLYAGIIYGLLGGILAWQVVDIFLMMLKEPVNQLANLYDSSLTLQGIGLRNTFIILGSSIALGWLASFMAVTRYLRRQ